MSLRDCGCGHWTGCNAKVTDEALIAELVKRGVLVKDLSVEDDIRPYWRYSTHWLSVEIGVARDD